MPRHILSVSLSVLFAAAQALAQDKKPTQRTDEQILKTVKFPEGYDGTVFASPPQIGYPTSVSAAVDGTIFVAVDENGSLDRNRNTADKPRGFVMRLRDTNGDGKADEFKRFASVESPRGVIWDGPNGTGPGTLYVMHPPALTAYTDTDGDGVSDKQEDIVTGLGFGLDFRGADHTTNGCRLGIDGFIYVAVGDYGYVEAKGKDGTVIKNRGGGIVRVRPDGTGLEIVSRGQRNIYDVAVSPTLDLFTRDNTNDGGGWDVRLSHVSPGAHMGYPYFFKNFPEDMVQPLAVLGGGSPCGSLWLDEPGMQNGLYTVEWGRSAIMYHPLKPKGATFEQQQVEWLKMVRPTDMDVDASGALYFTSWEGATFTYNGPNAGYVLRVTKKDAKPATTPDLKKSSDAQLVATIGGPSAVLREGALRELLRRGAKPDYAAGLRKIAETPGNVGPRVAAIQALLQIYGAKALPTLVQFTANNDLREYAITALGDDSRLAAQVPVQPLVAGLSDQNPRVRTAAIAALRRLHKTDAAQSILPLVADADPIVSHLAVRALTELKASQVCLGALDSADEKVKPGALRALYAMREPAVVEGLITRLSGAKGETRRGILNALCRLDMDDAPYTDPKVWWGTRPDTSGPVYQPIAWSETPKIEAALKKALDASSADDAKWLVQRMYLTKVNMPGLIELMLAKAGNDSDSKLTAIEAMFRSDNSLPPEALTALQGIAKNEKETPDFRAKALRLLQRASERSAQLDAAIDAFAPLAGQAIGQPKLSSAFEEFTRDSKHMKNIGVFAKLADSNDPAKRTLAQTILVNMATSNFAKGNEKQNAAKALEKSWAKPETAASLLGVIAHTKAKAFADQVDAHLKDPNNAVAEAALFAHQALGLGGNGAPAKQIGQMKYEEVFAAVQKGGDPVAGKEMYLRAGCIACHTITSDEPPKGPILSEVAKIYDRAALTESILKPNAKLAQGFESTWIKTKKGEQLEGFVTREGADNLDLRNIAGQTVVVEKGDVVERGHRPQSMMPEGLLNAFTPAELANLLAFLESLKK